MHTGTVSSRLTVMTILLICWPACIRRNACSTAEIGYTAIGLIGFMIFSLRSRAIILMTRATSLPLRLSLVTKSMEEKDTLRVNVCISRRLFYSRSRLPISTNLPNSQRQLKLSCNNLPTRKFSTTSISRTSIMARMFSANNGSPLGKMWSVGTPNFS